MASLKKIEQELVDIAGELTRLRALAEDTRHAEVKSQASLEKLELITRQIDQLEAQRVKLETLKKIRDEQLDEGLPKLKRLEESDGYYSEIQAELTAFRTIQEELRQTDPDGDRPRYEELRTTLQALYPGLQAKINAIEYRACHCSRCGGFSRPEYFGGSPCRCP